MNIRELIVKLNFESDEGGHKKAEGFLSSIAEKLESVKKFGENIAFPFNQIIDLAGEIAEPFMKIGEAIVENVNSVAEYGEAVKGLAFQTNSSTDGFQRLGKAVGAQGVSFEDFGNNMRVLSRNMAEASAGGKEQDKLFKQLGVTYKDSNGKLKSTDEVFASVAEGFKNLKDPGQRARVEMELFGRSAGPSLAAALSEGTEGLDKFKNASVFSPEELDASEEIIRTQREMANDTKSFWKEVIRPYLPDILSLLKAYREWSKANQKIISDKIHAAIDKARAAVKWFSDNADILKMVLFSIGVVALPTIITALSEMAIAAAAAALPMIGTALGVAAAWVVAAAPFIAIAASITALLLIMEDLNTWAKGGDSLFGRFLKQIDKWAHSASPDSPIVQTIKDFVMWVERAAKGVDNLLTKLSLGGAKNQDEVGDKYARTKDQNQYASDQQTLKAAQSVAAHGGALSDNMKGALQRQGMSEADFLTQYGGAPVAGSGAPAAVQNNVNGGINFNITAGPNATAQDIGTQVNDHLSGMFEDAGAAAGSGRP